MRWTLALADTIFNARSLLTRIQVTTAPSTAYPARTVPPGHAIINAHTTSSHSRFTVFAWNGRRLSWAWQDHEIHHDNPCAQHPRVLARSILLTRPQPAATAPNASRQDRFPIARSSIVGRAAACTRIHVGHGCDWPAHQAFLQHHRRRVGASSARSTTASDDRMPCDSA